MFTQEEWDHQESMDPEQGIGHNRDLYTVWSEKTNFLKIAADNDYFNSSYFLWLDIGAVRHSVRERIIVGGNILNTHDKVDFQPGADIHKE